MNENIARLFDGESQWRHFTEPVARVRGVFTLH